MQRWFNPAPNLSPPTALDRFFGLLVAAGLLVIGVALVLAAVVGWILLMIVVAAHGTGGTAILVICALIAMAGFALAVGAGAIWSILQIGSVRRALGIK